jgi:hypothetical protein
MKPHALIGAFFTFVTFAAFGQASSSPSIKELQTTCKTLADLTAEATAAQNLQDVVLYKRAADRIREHLGGGCEAGYFEKMMAENPSLKSTGIYLSIDFTKPIKGWTHHEIDRLLKVAESDGPLKVLQHLEAKDSTYQIDLEKLYEPNLLKKGRTDVFVLPKSEPPHLE